MTSKTRYETQRSKLMARQQRCKIKSRPFVQTGSMYLKPCQRLQKQSSGRFFIDMIGEYPHIFPILEKPGLDYAYKALSMCYSTI